MSNDKEELSEHPQTLGFVVRDLAQRLMPRLQAFERSLREFVVAAEPYLANLVENVNKLPGRIAAVQKTLAQRGWFIPPEVPAMTFIKMVEQHTDAGQMEELDAQLTNYIDSQLTKIERNLSAKYPNRAALFEEAFKAHRSQMYASSITVFLTQADGICIDSLGEKFFSMETVKSGVKQPRTKKVIEAYGVGVLQEIMLAPLLSGSGMGASEKEQALYSDSLNRHRVMHGIDTTYPNKMNSAKAISLVAYLGVTAHKTLEELKLGSRR